MGHIAQDGVVSGAGTLFQAGQDITVQGDLVVHGVVPERGKPPVGRLLTEVTDPFGLEVHRPWGDERHDPLEGAFVTDPFYWRRSPLPESPVLPSYVPRPHDVALRAARDEAMAGHHRVITLVGASSTGKTRACWEAVRGLPPGWRLWHPINPDRAEACLAGLPFVGPRTVIWLNDVQHYLSGPVGERAAAGLRELLGDTGRGPVLVLATTWPEHFTMLTADQGGHARVLLEGTAIEVPAKFTARTYEAAWPIAARDRRLDTALRRAEDGRVVQYLAGAPAVLERYRYAPPAAQALVHAAVDVIARRGGRDLPAILLTELGAQYLAGRAELRRADWFSSAVEYLTAPCRGVPGPFEVVHDPSGSTCYRLADYLVHELTWRRLNVSCDAEFWNSLLAHATPAQLPVLAVKAEARHLYRCAYRAHRKAGDLFAAVSLLYRCGRAAEALVLLRGMASTGHVDAVRHAAALRRYVRRMRKVVRKGRRCSGPRAAADAFEAAGVLVRSGRHRELLIWAGELIAADQVSLAYEALIHHALEAGCAEIIADQLVEAGLPGVMEPEADSSVLTWRKGMMRDLNSRLIRVLKGRLEDQEPFDLLEAVLLANQAGDREAEIGFALRAVEADLPLPGEQAVDRPLFSEALRILHHNGKSEDAFRLARYGLAPGATIAEPWPAE
ncbi:hypothetical protein AB0A74_05485 [Saccharothrix sp. NPDC042600]|uniref:hypothetical protein n=1 Tax=Saccharothrix TaxID=2071 RepID=UPI0033DB242F|nr:hypothetical protein GCM10017745_37600 [Saccharothrix mutabilis subsp. capreolus]